MTTTIRLATRKSRLALEQANLVMDALKRINQQLSIELVLIETEGDIDRETPLTVLGGRGVFVKAVEQALLDDVADIAVHSLKDVPTEEVSGLIFPAITERADPSDVLVANNKYKLAELSAGCKIGTSSRRRAVLLSAIRPDLEVVDIRGNIDTRIQKVHDGVVDAVILAASRIERLGMDDEISQRFDPQEFIPAPGQGALAVQCRDNDEDIKSIVQSIDHANTRRATDAERAFLSVLGVGCSFPVGAYAVVDNKTINLRAMVLTDDTKTMPDFGDAIGGIDEAIAIGSNLGRQLLSGPNEDGAK